MAKNRNFRIMTLYNIGMIYSNISGKKGGTPHINSLVQEQ
jgi:hypothetical protein